MTQTVTQPPPGDGYQKRAQLGRRRELPAALGETAQQAGPDRLHHVHRVELTLQLPRHLPAGHQPQEGEVIDKNLLDGQGIAAPEGQQQAFQWIVCHFVGRKSQVVSRAISTYEGSSFGFFSRQRRTSNVRGASATNT